MLSAMQYPHWLMVAGAVLVVLGFIGFAFSQNKNAGQNRGLLPEQGVAGFVESQRRIKDERPREETACGTTIAKARSAAKS
jgi:hypothetical protein